MSDDRNAVVSFPAPPAQWIHLWDGNHALSPNPFWVYAAVGVGAPEDPPKEQHQ